MMKLPNDGKKGITVKIDAELHAEVRQYIESHSMTMGEFVTLALQDELHPKFNMKEEKYMGNMRTMAFQVPEDLFQRIKDYLQRNNMTQKEFVIGLIEDELERDLSERESISEAPEDLEEETEEYAETEENASVDDFETVSEDVPVDTEEQTDADFSDDFEGLSEESEDEDEDESEDKNMGFSMGM